MTSHDRSQGKQGKKINQSNTMKTPTRLVNVILGGFIFKYTNNRKVDVILSAQATYNSCSSLSDITFHTYLDINAKPFFPNKFITSALPNPHYVDFNESYMLYSPTQLFCLNPKAKNFSPQECFSSTLEVDEPCKNHIGQSLNVKAKVFVPKQLYKTTNMSYVVGDDAYIRVPRVQQRSNCSDNETPGNHEFHSPTLFNITNTSESSIFEDFNELSVPSQNEDLLKTGLIIQEGDCAPGNTEKLQTVGEELNNLKINNLNRIILGHININSIRNKFEDLKYIIKDKIDILLISETKIDNSFPEAQFSIDGYSKPYRYDRNAFGGGYLAYFRKDIPCRQLNDYNIGGNTEGTFIEINIGKKKWLLFFGYNPHKGNISNFLQNVTSTLDKYLKSYDNILVMGDFNSEFKEGPIKLFCESYNLKSLIKTPTCYKNPTNPTCIDLILTNRFNSFQNSITIETGLSDFHKMTVTVMKSHFQKKGPRLLMYRNYNFNESLFRDELTQEMGKNCSEENPPDYDTFHRTFMSVLEKYAPIKKKKVRANNAPFMNKDLSKAIMTRSRLRNRYNKTPSHENLVAYKKHRNFCVKLCRITKRNYYNNIKLNKITDNKSFWNTIKPLFSDKQTVSQQITLIEGDDIIYKDKEVADKMNNFFVNAIENLNIEDPFILDDSSLNGLENCLQKFQNHPSIMKIKEVYKITESFSFSTVENREIETIISELNKKSATVYNDIPAKVLQNNSDIISPIITKIYENAKEVGIFPTPLKTGNVTPVHKKGEMTIKENYRPISILPTVSKIYERNMCNEIQNYIDKYLSPYLCGFRKGFGTQHCLAVMVEVWKKAIDLKEHAGGVLTDLSKAFDCLNHELLIAKLATYGFSEKSLKFLYNYLSERKQKTRINNSFSTEGILMTGVPQGSILGPLLFNIYINDMFLFVPEINIANYADDTTPYTTSKCINSLLKKLEDNTSEIVKWLRNNYMKSNSDKNHLIVTNCEKACITIDNNLIQANTSVKLLGVTIDNKLNFDEHISKICKTVSTKLHALARVAKFMTSEKLRIIMKSFIESQFGYCPLIWMFHSRKLNNRINKLHERALRLVYKDPYASFQELLDRDKTVTIHHRNLQKLATEMFKVKNGESPEIMKNIFQVIPKKYNLRNNRIWATHNVRTVYHGMESLSFRGPKTWDILPKYLKEATSLKQFKKEIKEWKPEGCTCRLCKIYVENIGFL